MKVLSPNHCTTRKFLVLFSQRSPGPSSKLAHRRTPKIQEWLNSPPHLHTHICVLCSVTQSCLTLCDPMNYIPPGSSVHGISQARRLEWVAISFSIIPRVTLYCSARIHTRISKGKGTWGEIHKKSGLRFHVFSREGT